MTLSERSPPQQALSSRPQRGEPGPPGAPSLAAAVPDKRCALSRMTQLGGRGRLRDETWGSSMPPGPLAGLKVLDCTHVIAGAWCSMMLADMGADVVKIEPLAGETTRGHPKARFRAFDFVNRNKRSLAVDMARPEGAGAIRRLAKD